MTDVDVNVNVDVDAGVCVDVDHVWGEVSAFNTCCVFWNVSAKRYNDICYEEQITQMTTSSFAADVDVDDNVPVLELGHRLFNIGSPATPQL